MKLKNMDWKVACAILLVAGGAAGANAQDAAAPKIQEVIYGHKDGLALTLDVYQPDKPNGAAVVFMVSGGWYSKWAPPESMLGLFKPYLAAGFTTVAMRHGSSPRYGIADAVGDVRRGVRFLRLHSSEYGIDPDRMGVMGMSAGGHLTLMLATASDEGNSSASDPVERQSSRIAAAVAFVPPTDLTVVWDAPDSDPQYRNFPALNLPVKDAVQVSPVTFVTKDDAPSLVMMGEADKLVPAKHGTWIQEKFAAAGVENKLIIYEGSGHGLEGNQDKAQREGLEWFIAHLAK